jgi:hypothetical protein
MKYNISLITLATLASILLAGCSSSSYHYTADSSPPPSRNYTLLDANGSSDDIIVRCPGAFLQKEGNTDHRRRVHCSWEFVRNSSREMRFSSESVRLMDSLGGSFGPSEVRVNGLVDRQLDLGAEGSAIVDIFFDLGENYDLRNLKTISLHWNVDTAGKANSFTTRFYQVAPTRTEVRHVYYPRTRIGLGLGYYGHHRRFYGSHHYYHRFHSY